METALVTTKGQIVIPARLRHRLKIKKGTRVCFIEHGEEIIMRPVTDEYIDALRGSVQIQGKALKNLLTEKQRERRQ